MAVENAELTVIKNPAIPRIRRQDAYWVQPLLIIIVFTSFIVYTTWRVFEGSFYNSVNYPLSGQPVFHLLSPYYSPTFGENLHIFGFPISPAIWILPFPLLFRGTCYYYRKAYYRAFFWDPLACAVDEVASRKNYTGERAFPLVVQNIHRYAFYFAAIIMVILWYDAFDAFRYTGSDGVHFGVSVGSIVLLINVILLSLYTFGCHAWRHLIGGCLDCYSCSGAARRRHGIWEQVTHLNENHALWAWLSLFSVALTDLYVRLVCSGAVPDVKLFG